MTKKLLGSIVCHGMFAGSLTMALLRAMPDPKTYIDFCGLIAAGFGVSALWVLVGMKWEYEWQNKVRDALHLRWWRPGGDEPAAWAFSIGSMIGTALGVLWR